MTGATDVRAIQDVGCLTAAKFFYHFPHPISYEVIDGFHDCDIVSRAFSKTIRSAKDLVGVKRRGEFSADFVIGGTRAVVYFTGSARNMPRKAIDAFGQRLRAAGYDRVLYSVGPRPLCDRCPTGVSKGCSGTGAT